MTVKFHVTARCYKRPELQVEKTKLHSDLDSGIIVDVRMLESESRMLFHGHGRQHYGGKTK
jgi:hypothetical protein